MEPANTVRDIVMVMPRMDSATELWLQRIRDGLSNELAGIATFDEVEEPWKGVPRASLTPRWRSLLRKAGIVGEGSTRLPRISGLRQLIQQPGVETVYCHFASLAVRIRKTLQLSGKRVFVHCHGYDVTWDLRHPLSGKPQYNKSYPIAVRELSRFTTFIANSETARGRLLEIGVPAEKVVVHYFGVPTQDYLEPEPTSVLRVLYLGRLIEAKGPLETILAFERACERGLVGELHLAGDGPLRSACEANIAASAWRDRIKMYGTVPAEQGIELRKRCQVFTAHNQLGKVTRQEEAFGVSIIEAMADGLPVVTGRSGGVRETVVDGETGFLFDPGDICAHADALVALADPALRRRMGYAGWLRAREKFDLNRNLEKLRVLLGLSGRNMPDVQM